MSQESVKVVIRARPLSSSEISRGNTNIVSVDQELNQISILDSKSVPKTFAFDGIYNENYTQQQIYDETAFPLVESVLEGYNGTIFAYGQTGCGKTFTMVGVPGDEVMQGIIPNSFGHIFGCISESGASKCFLVRCSYSEIYNEEVRDLISNDPTLKLELKESADKSIYVKNLSMHVVKSVVDIERLMEFGNKHRITKETNMNERSSRSHAIFTIYIETSEEKDGRSLVKAGKLNLVDLAGSERQKKTGASGDRLKEGIKINLSLHALGNVITSLVDGSSHVPYRDSKLTLLLQDSLGGNTKTVMIAVISPADYNYDESLSTLRYASRAKFIKNKPKVNEDPKDALLRSYAEEIQRLKSMISAQNNGQITQIIEIKQAIYKNNAENESEDSTQSDGDRNNSKNIEEIISDFQTQLIMGGEALNKAEQAKTHAIRSYRLKLRKQKKREKELIDETRKREEEMLYKEQNYQSMQDELEDLRRVVKKLRTKYKTYKQEIEDVNHENELNKQELLERVWQKEKENELMHCIFETIIPKRELRTIKSKSSYDEINHKWKVPSFVIQQKQIQFPKIQKSQLMEINEGKYVNFLDSGNKKTRNESADSVQRHKFQHQETGNLKNLNLIPLAPIDSKSLTAGMCRSKEDALYLRNQKHIKNALQPMNYQRTFDVELRKSVLGGI